MEEDPIGGLAMKQPQISLKGIKGFRDLYQPDNYFVYRQWQCPQFSGGVKKNNHRKHE